MQITYKVGDLLTNVTTGHIVHGCNARGFQGGGFAKFIKAMYPGEYADYRRVHISEGLVLGTAYPYCHSSDLVIWNAITQQDFGNDNIRYVSYDAIETCFASINECILALDDVAQEIHIPKIGSGLANGNWEIISRIIEETVTVPITCWVLPT